jgi:hypothetical protein
LVEQDREEEDRREKKRGRGGPASSVRLALAEDFTGTVNGLSLTGTKVKKNNIEKRREKKRKGEKREKTGRKQGENREKTGRKQGEKDMSLGCLLNGNYVNCYSVIAWLLGSVLTNQNIT